MQRPAPERTTPGSPDSALPAVAGRGRVLQIAYATLVGDNRLAPLRQVTRERHRPPRVLDVGCGNHSPSVLRFFSPECEYWGVDREPYNLDRSDLRAMHRFVRADLERDPLNEIPDDYFDLAILSHVLEHLHAPFPVLRAVAAKLTRGGVIYVEFPSPESVGFPRAHGSLNFYDDSSHVTLLRREQVADTLGSLGLTPLSVGVQRGRRKVLLALPITFAGVLAYGQPFGPALWDIYGFSSFVLARKSDAGSGATTRA